MVCWLGVWSKFLMSGLWERYCGDKFYRICWFGRGVEGVMRDREILCLWMVMLIIEEVIV